MQDSFFKLLLIQIQEHKFKEKILDLQEQNITDTQIQALVPILNHNPYIITLILDHNNLTDDCTKALSSVSYITNLSMSACNLTNSSIPPLAAIKNLQQLNLSFNAITDSGLRPFFNNNMLRMLNLRGNNNLTENCMDILSSFTYLSNLNISNTKIKEGSILLEFLHKKEINILSMQSLSLSNDFICEAMPSIQVKELNLAQNQIQNTGAQALFKNGYLQSVDLSYNNITDECLVNLSSSKITDLSLANNKLTNTSILWINQHKILLHLNIDKTEINEEALSFLKDHPSLNYLSAQWLKLSDKAALALSTSKHLHTLILGHNHICDEGAISLITRLNLKHLNLNFNLIKDRTMEAVENNTSLTTLHLIDNTITDRGLALLSHNTNIHDLNISYNLITNEGLKVLLNHPSLSILGLHGLNISPELMQSLFKKSNLRIIKLDPKICKELPDKFFHSLWHAQATEFSLRRGMFLEYRHCKTIPVDINNANTAFYPPLLRFKANHLLYDKNLNQLIYEFAGCATLNTKFKKAP